VTYILGSPVPPVRYMLSVVFRPPRVRDQKRETWAHGTCYKKDASSDLSNVRIEFHTRRCVRRTFDQFWRAVWVQHRTKGEVGKGTVFPMLTKHRATGAY